MKVIFITTLGYAIIGLTNTNKLVVWSTDHWKPYNQK